MTLKTVHFETILLRVFCNTHMELILQNFTVLSILYCADSWKLAIYGK